MMKGRKEEKDVKRVWNNTVYSLSYSSDSNDDDAHADAQLVCSLSSLLFVPYHFTIVICKHPSHHPKHTQKSLHPFSS
jgi:hypothetical protein